MRQIIYYAILIIVFCLVITGYEFSTSPFKFKVNSWTEFIGWVLLFVAIVCITTANNKTEYDKGYQDARNEITEYFNHKSNK